MSYIIVRDYEARYGFVYEVLHKLHQMTFLQSPKYIETIRKHNGFKTLGEARMRARIYDGDKRAFYILGPRGKKHLITN